jgi:hypothetical protein
MHPEMNSLMSIVSDKMDDDARLTNPKKIKVTSQFADYLQKSVVITIHEPPKHFSGGTIGSWRATPIEIDDTIENEYYELVYEEN